MMRLRMEALTVPVLVVPEKAYKRLRDLAEAKGMGVEELVLDMGLEEAGPAEGSEA